MLNVLSDGTTATVGFGILARKTEGRDHLFRSLSRFTSGLSDTAKAFLIIAGGPPLPFDSSCPNPPVLSLCGQGVSETTAVWAA